MARDVVGRCSPGVRPGLQLVRAALLELDAAPLALDAAFHRRCPPARPRMALRWALLALWKLLCRGRRSLESANREEGRMQPKRAGTRIPF